MNALSFRENVFEDDVDKVATILHKTGFFEPDEEIIGISLVKEHLKKGTPVGIYLFLVN